MRNADPVTMRGDAAALGNGMMKIFLSSSANSAVVVSAVASTSFFRSLTLGSLFFAHHRRDMRTSSPMFSHRCWGRIPDGFLRLRGVRPEVELCTGPWSLVSLGVRCRARAVEMFFSQT
ncbi:unnamed protein product [Prorocentrum cordatum]|uniref:Uncharacterized protein n=1 Tax=Prorocentrum cordatum TaxID=2364126 RepID=A0ABN9SUD6_9DINO|nr:unnamed protein product [Polarella glacialis]